MPFTVTAEVQMIMSQYKVIHTVLPTCGTLWRDGISEKPVYNFCNADKQMLHHLIVRVSVLHPDDNIFHRFIWRKNQHDLSTVYQWLRLNFGSRPASDIASIAINILARASQGDFLWSSKSTTKVSWRHWWSQFQLTKCSEKVSPKSKRSIKTASVLIKPVVNAIQICLVIGGTGKKTVALKKD